MNLDDLRAVMNPLAELGRGEETFVLEGVTLRLRTLTPAEEIASFRYARAAIVEGERADQATGMDYLDRFRVVTLSYALIQVGNLDLSSTEYVETGEKLENGTPIRITKSEAVMQILSGWSREMLTKLYGRFGELQFRVEDQIARAVSLDDLNYETEIARLEERLADLREQQARRKAGAEDPRAAVLREAASEGQRRPGKPEELKPESEGAFLEESSPEPEAQAWAVALPVDLPRGLEEPVPAAQPAAPEPTPRNAEEPLRSAFEGLKRGSAAPVPAAAPEAPSVPDGDEPPATAPSPVVGGRRPPHLDARAIYREVVDHGSAPAPGKPGVQGRFRPVPGK